jgi:Holliday junction resolvase RusA-like endonuclease
VTLIVQPARVAVPDLSVRVYGHPAPQGSKRHVGNGVMVESSKHVKPWREDVRAAARAVIDETPGWQTLLGPLLVDMVFTVRKPASAPKRRRTWPDRMPDVSKLCRSTEDALTSAAAWKDDAQVVEYGRLAKVYANEDRDALDAPGAVIRIWRIAVDPSI